MFEPGMIVNARNRDWIVLSGSNDEWLKLRPLSGSDDSVSYVIPSLENPPITITEFSLPSNDEYGNLYDSSLFRNAAMLRLKDAAGPLRCLGHIAVEPKSFQLTPLLMALKMEIVRLLIADDVGIGKTIEACLIARELLDRYEIERLSVLCPPHLVEQWVSELHDHFNLNAVGLTSSSVYSLEKKVPAGMQLTEFYPITVVSLDYIKNQNRREGFIQTAPELIIVDEAHTCTEKSNSSKQQRFSLLEALSKKVNRHMIFLTATPHSGDSNAFGNLLSLIDPKFRILADAQDDNTDLRPLRLELADHFIQRQRVDLKGFEDNPNFAHRLRTEFAYKFNSEWANFFDKVREYCFNLGKKSEKNNNPTIWYAILALFRSVASSPESAIKALEGRLDNSEDNESALDNSFSALLDKNSEGATDVDITNILCKDKELHNLLSIAKDIQLKEDPKFNLLVNVLNTSILNADEENPEGYRPIIFCKYIATAKYVARKLQEVLPKKYTICVVTGELPSEEREEQIEALQMADFPILVATDCLSEGVNLQNIFTAVIHYDLAWNPTKHEQREGRVDRFGQNSKTVKCCMLYGADNPVDGLILKVILRKAERIRTELGIMVPVPNDGESIQSALIKATMLKKNQDTDGQLYLFDFDEIEKNNLEEQMEKPWEDALEKAKKNRTVFAQRSIDTDSVYALLSKEKAILGSDKEVEQFVCTILNRLGATPRKTSDRSYILPLDIITNSAVKELCADYDMRGPMKASFQFPTPSGYIFIHRSHPLVEILSSFVFEYVMDRSNDKRFELGTRCSVTETNDIERKTVLYLLRHRIQLTSSGSKSLIHTSMVEETILLQWHNHCFTIVDDKQYKKYLDVKPTSVNLNRTYIQRNLEKAASDYKENRNQIASLLQIRCQELLNENRLIRKAANGQGVLKAVNCNPEDVLGIYVLVPGEEAL